MVCQPTCENARPWSANLHVRMLDHGLPTPGTIGLARLAVSYLYKDDFHLEPATVRPITLYIHESHMGPT
jgi:hypothetical protein